MLHSAARSYLLVAALGLIAATSGCSSAESRLARHMQLGQEYFEAGNFDKARVEFSNALQTSPEDAEARYMSGRVAERLGKIRDAVGAYQGAIDSNPDHIQARANLGRVFVFAGAPEQAMKTLEPALAKHPDDADLLTARGAARSQLKDMPGAMEDAERAVKVAPANENAIALLASLYRQSENPARAAELLRSSIEKLPKSVDLRQVLATLYMGGGEPVLAEEQLAEVVKLKPDVPAHRLQLALLHTRLKKLDDAERVLQEGMKRLPENRELKLAYVDFLLAQRSREAGEKALQGFIEKDPQDFELQMALGSLRERSGDTKTAMSMYQKIVDLEKDKPQGLSARNRIAAIHVREGRVDEAKKLIAEVLAGNPRDNDALIMRGNLALANNDAASAISDLRAVLRDQPESVGVLRALARAHLANGEASLADEQLRKAMTLAPRDPAVRVELAQLLAQTQRLDQATKLMEEAASAAPNDVTVRESLARMYLSAGDLGRAQSAAEDIKTLRPDLAIGYYLAGVTAAGQKRTADAQRELARALEIQPSAIDALAAITRIDVAAGKLPAAVARATTIVEKDPGNAPARNLLGELQMGAKEYAAAQQQFEAAVKLAPKSWMPHRNLALLRLEQKDLPGAIAAYKRGIDVTGHEGALVTGLATLYEQQGSSEEAITLYEAALALNPRQEYVSNNLAMTLITHRKDAASLDRARDLTAAFASTNNGALLDTYGWIRFKRGEVQTGLAALERAAELMPQSAIVRYHLGMAQLQSGQKDKAKLSLKAALSENQRFAGLEEARAALATLETKAG